MSSGGGRREQLPNKWEAWDEAQLRDECLLGDLLRVWVWQEGAGQRCLLERDRDEERIECEFSCDEG